MNPTTADLILTLIIDGISHLAELKAVFAKAQAENRDINDADLDGLSVGAQARLDALRADIAAGTRVAVKAVVTPPVSVTPQTPMQSPFPAV